MHKILLLTALALLFGCSGKCGDKSYNDKTQFCSENKIYEKCGGKEFDPKTQFCNAQKIEERCNGKTINLKTQFCYNNSDVVDKCEGKEYNPVIQFCYNGNVIDKCRGSEFNPETQFCAAYGVYGIQNLCDGKEFNPADKICIEDKIEQRCGENGYDPNKQLCIDNTIYEKCGEEPYSSKASGSCKNGKFVFNYGKLEDIRDGKTYKTIKIGEQVWFAENLNHEPRTCYGRKESEKEANCKKYGGLYMLYVGTINKDKSIPDVCPEGWHIPSIEDWNALLDYVGDDAANKLKAKKGWSKHDGKANNGMDIFGFSALPGGYYQDPCCDEDGPTLSGIGEEGTWWAVGGTFRICDYDNVNKVSVYDGSGGENTCSYSIRCVKDYSPENH